MVASDGPTLDAAHLMPPLWAQVKRALASSEGAAIIEVSDAVGTFCGFADRTARAAEWNSPLPRCRRRH
jgi:hypothetical protein